MPNDLACVSAKCSGLCQCQMVSSGLYQCQMVRLVSVPPSLYGQHTMALLLGAHRLYFTTEDKDGDSNPGVEARGMGGRGVGDGGDLCYDRYNNVDQTIRKYREAF